jgi:diguanylate cyclase (GGDEF)-like protein
LTSTGNRRVRGSDDSGYFPLITSQGRPKEHGRGIPWVPLTVRLVALMWAGTIMVALLDEFGGVSHLPFLLSTGMTGFLVTVIFLMTRREGDNGPDADEVDEAQDLLTELPTFNHFARRLSDEFSRSRRMGRPISVVLVDVNNLSAVNKEYGVRAGDTVLRHVARTIEATKRVNDVVARLGDDEFGVLLIDTGEDGIESFIERLEDRLARESAVADVSGRPVSLWAGICSGNVTATPDVTHAEALLEAAMASLDEAKHERERRRRMWLSA